MSLCRSFVLFARLLLCALFSSRMVLVPVPVLAGSRRESFPGQSGTERVGRSSRLPD